MTDFFATVIGWVLRAVLVLAGLVFFLSLLAAATLLALLWLLRALWARATGQPVVAWRMGIDPRAGATQA